MLTIMSMSLHSLPALESSSFSHEWVEDDLDSQREAVEYSLEQQPIVDDIQLEASVNEVRLLSLEDGTKGVFKPMDGEKYVRYDIENGTGYKRDRAAYVVSRALDQDLVPPTVIREVDGRLGSLQHYIENAKTFGQLGIGQEALNAMGDKHPYYQELTALWLLDCTMWNTDRNFANVLVNGTKLWAIDNSLTFGQSDLKVLTHYSGHPIPQPQIEPYVELASSQQKIENLYQDLESLLESQEIEACLSRIQRLAQELSKKSQLDSRYLMNNPAVRPFYAMAAD